ncbi:hypothetical protein L226DRAFT_529226 [Lentinus tigrinus ALCF2SS1-7]|uniref:UBC core domain-containing protein n=1 Tax=Lentinus tigrinus ALCF2SS1-6 TaxID=1328759 RepID=A0A5C2SU50_9APHY|nr:hypothetical protein L227DRAFT_569036 [Lentinus tigrinus ALCF2SS1-6]RPD80767.1 hypothetical protein L226DRAFT_529226 [Lentinus tigrinus ALCF2SS1-7]
MAPATQKRAAAKFYQEDIVQRKDDPNTFGVVLRCWQDAEDLPAPADNVDPLMRPLVQGEVGVSYFPRPVREIISEDKLDLVDRMYQPGDLLKRSVDDVRSGIVTSMNVRGRLEHAISGEKYPSWLTEHDVESAVEVDMGDYVVYNDWVGQVIEMFDEAWIEVTGGNLVRLPELSARLAIGEKGPDILPQPMSTVQGLFGFLLGSTRPSTADTVVSVKHTVLAISWLAINQSLTPEEAEAKPRPQRIWHGADLGKLTVLSRRAEEAVRVGDRVRIKNDTSVHTTQHGKSSESQGVITVDTYIVQETKSTVNVLWQDGTRDALDTRNTVPYLNPDEYDCWPGDHVVWKTEDSKRHVVVQSVNAQERTAQVLVVETGAIELASVLELDPHGTNDWSAVASSNDGLGVRRGDLVFIHREGTTNGVEPPMVPRIGEVEEWAREPPQVGADGHLGGWRRDMANIGTRIAENRGKEGSVEEPPLKRPEKGDTSLNWFGEVVDLHLDGTIEIVLPNDDKVTLPLNRLTRLYDSVEQFEDLWGDDEGTIDEGEDVEVWEMTEDGRWVEGAADDDDEWESAEEGEDEVMHDAMDVEDASGQWSPSTDTVIPSHAELEAAQPGDSRPASSNGRPQSPDVPQDAMDIEDEPEEGSSEWPWKRFEVLPEAPPDHAFYNTIPAQPSRQFLARLSKEYKALRSSLPDSILVRTYEDRSDLLRSLIIGPENTPYENAPFVIDWMLDANFPQTPPIAHFLSWTNGNGRVNPNLYEEGKVCLSILGTWAGDKSESWSAARSSLLQAFVSIQGLVLVKEPWFCEPAYEKLRGTEDGMVNSRLYNEKAYVLSRGFVRRALEIPLGGLEAELNWLYYTNGKLKKVLDDARALIEKSKATKEDTEADRELAVPRLSGGGIITLERTLVKLQALLDAYPGSGAR